MQVAAIDYHALAEGEDATQSTALPTLQEYTSVRWLKDTASLAEALMHVRCPLMRNENLADCQDDGLWRDVPCLDKLIIDAPSEFSGFSHVLDANSAYLDQSDLTDEWRAGEDDPPLLDEPAGSVPHVKVLLLEEEKTPRALEDQTWSPWQLPTELLEEDQSDGSVVDDVSCCKAPHGWLDSVLLGGKPTYSDDCSPNSLPDTPDFNADLEADLFEDIREAFEKAGALPPEVRAWLTIPAADILPTLSDLDLGIDTWLPLATSKASLSLPDAEDLLSPWSPSHTYQEAVPGGDAPATGGEGAQMSAALSPPEILEDDPDVVDWSAGWELSHISLINLGVATLPSLWELEGVVDRKYENPHPDRSLFGASRPAPLPETTQKQLAEIFEGSCWRLGHKQLDMPSFPVPELSSLLPMSGEAAALLQGDGRGSSGLSLRFVGSVASTSFLASSADKPGGAESQNVQMELRSSDINELLHVASGDEAHFANLSSSWQGARRVLCRAEENTFSVDDESIWPAENSQAQPPMTRLKVFQKLGPLPLSLVSDRARMRPLKAKKVEDVDRGARAEPIAAQQVGRSGSLGVEARKKCAQHFYYDVLPVESDLVFQLRGDMELVWATYCSHTDGAGSADALVPDSDGLQALLRQHAEDFLRAKEAGHDATDTQDLYRILLALHILQAIHAELTESGILQAVFCADALLTRLPPSLIDGNIWTCQAIHKLHSTIVQVCQASSDGKDIIHSAGATMTCGGTPKQFCAYAKCAGCAPSSLTLAERSKAGQLFYLGDAAAARGRWLVIVFASQCVLEAVCCCCWRFGDGRNIIVLNALTPLWQSAQQIYAAGVGLVLAHETALHTSFIDGVGDEQDSLSAEKMVAQWEISRLLQQHCTVVSYQPLTLPAVDAFVDVHLAMRAAGRNSSAPPMGPQPVPVQQEVPRQMQADASHGTGARSHPSRKDDAPSEARPVASSHPAKEDHELHSEANRDRSLDNVANGISQRPHGTSTASSAQSNSRRNFFSDPGREVTTDQTMEVPQHAGDAAAQQPAHRFPAHGERSRLPPRYGAAMDEWSHDHQEFQHREDASEPKHAHDSALRRGAAEDQQSEHHFPFHRERAEKEMQNQRFSQGREHANAQKSNRNVPQFSEAGEPNMRNYQHPQYGEEADQEDHHRKPRQPSTDPDAGQNSSRRTEFESRAEAAYLNNDGDLPKFRDTCQRLKRAWDDQDMADHEFSGIQTPGHAHFHDRESRHEPAQQSNAWDDDFSFTPPCFSERTRPDRHTPEGKSMSRGRASSSGQSFRHAPQHNRSRSEGRRSENASAWGRVQAMNLSYGDAPSSGTGKYFNGRGEKRRLPDSGSGMFSALRAPVAHAPATHHSVPRRSARSSREGMHREQVGRAPTRNTPVRFDPWMDQN